MINDMLQNMNESQKQIFVDHYESTEAWEQHMMEAASDEKVQMNFAKVAEWYGGKEAVRESIKNQPNSEVFAAYQKRIDDIQKRIAEEKGPQYGILKVFQGQISRICVRSILHIQTARHCLAN